MARPKLQEVAHVAEIIAAVAVILSLLYVGQEVRNNTAAIRGAATQSIVTTDADALLTIAADSALSEIVRIGFEDPSALSEGDAFRFFLFVRNFWLSFQNIHTQTALGLVDAADWESYRIIICDMRTRPGIAELWPQERAVLKPGFVAAVESC